MKPLLTIPLLLLCLNGWGQKFDDTKYEQLYYKPSKKVQKKTKKTISTWIDQHKSIYHIPLKYNLSPLMYNPDEIALEIIIKLAYNDANMSRNSIDSVLNIFSTTQPIYEQKVSYKNLFDSTNCMLTFSFTGKGVLQEIQGFKNGRMESNRFYQNGQLSLKKFYHKNGKLSSKTQFRNDKPDGVSMEWFLDGSKYSRTTYKNGFVDSVVYYHPNGLKLLEGSYALKETGWNLDTLWVYEDGFSESVYEEFEIIPMIVQYKQYREGLWRYWYKNGELKREDYYENGKRVNRIDNIKH